MPVHAQAAEPNPVYIVQAGDTLTTIALRFGVPLDRLISVNNIPNPNALQIGSKINIPGYEGISGVLTAKAVQIGENLRSLTVKNQIPLPNFLKLNRVTSPEELFAGATLILPEASPNTSGVSATRILENSQSLLEISVLSNSSRWNIDLVNNTLQTHQVLPGEPVFYYSSKPTIAVTGISPWVKNIQVTPLPLTQGKTISIRLTTNQPVTLSGSLAGNKLNFITESENQYVALQGIHALADPGLTPLSINIVDTKGTTEFFEENLLLKSGAYIKDPPLTVDPNTLNPATTKPEEELIKEILQRVTTNKLWSGKFRLPVDEPICLKSTYGNRRSYNNSPFNYFHSGVDFGVCKNLNIYAPANGVVVFAGPLTVRGNATIIDHGWGVFSGYWHQSQIKVKVGDQVKAGQLIGLVGATGRVTGPHLHWEMIINGVQVEPLDWLEQTYP